jgi:hypothetical protein
VGGGEGIFSVEPKILARLANTGSAANARLSLCQEQNTDY